MPQSGLLDESPLVSVVVPCRNEAAHITGMLESLLKQDYPRNRMEILLIDGMSDDGTRETLMKYSQNHTFIKVYDNPRKGIPQAVNIGIRHAKGEFIVRVDVHCAYPGNYVSRLIYWQNCLNTDNVGGIWLTKAGANTDVAETIAYVLSVPFGVGGALYRTGISEPTEVDTVPFGCFRRSLFDEIGLFDETMARTEDDEFNARLKKAGGHIYLVPDICIIYYARDTIRKLLRMLFQYGYFKPLVAVKHGRPTAIRQLLPFVFVVTLSALSIGSIFFHLLAIALVGVVTLHFALGAISSIRLAKDRGFACAVLAPSLFFMMHLAYGFGYFRALLEIFLLKSHSAYTNKDVALSR